MQITSLLENTKQDSELTARHGLSMYIETEQMKLIFDTGPDRSYISNAQKLGIDLNQADVVVISHGHSDHIGGLSSLNEVNTHAQIYLSPYAFEPHWLKLGKYFHKVGAKSGLQEVYGNRLNYVENDIEIMEGIHIITLEPTDEFTNNLYKGTVKELDDFKHEIMLVIENKHGMVLFTGCSHHGVVHMANIALKKFPGKSIDAIIGGFHLIGIPILNTLGKTKEEIISIGHELNQMPIRSIYSCHCTGSKGYRILNSVLKDKLHAFPTGKKISLD